MYQSCIRFSFYCLISMKHINEQQLWCYDDVVIRSVSAYNAKANDVNETYKRLKRVSAQRKCSLSEILPTFHT